MLSSIRNFLADRPAIFSWLRKLIELNFTKEKKIIRKVFNLNDKNKKILDIGCGTGEFAPLFSNLNYYGIDISKNYIKYAQRKKPGNFQVMSATKLDFADNNFDYILIMAVLHHLNDQDMEKVMAEAKRVLKPGGKLLIMEDAKIPKLENFIVKFFQKFDKGDYIRPPEEYKKVALKHFKVVSEQSFRNGGIVYYGLILQN